MKVQTSGTKYFVGKIWTCVLCLETVRIGTEVRVLIHLERWGMAFVAINELVLLPKVYSTYRSQKAHSPQSADASTQKPFTLHITPIHPVALHHSLSSSLSKNTHTPHLEINVPSLVAATTRLIRKVFPLILKGSKNSLVARAPAIGFPGWIVVVLERMPPPHS